MSLCLSIAASGLAALNLSAATLHVWQESPNPGPPYSDWSTAARTIRAAVDAAQAEDTVLVTNGSYASVTAKGTARRSRNQNQIDHGFPG